MATQFSPAEISSEQRELHDEPVGRQEWDDLFSVAYEQLRRLAASIGRKDRAAMASPTSLVHASWLRLARSLKLPPQSELHCKHLVAQAMRQLLVEEARRRHAQKRGGLVRFVAFDESLGVPMSSDRDLVALDDALNELAQVSPRQAAMIECQFFAEMSVPDIATRFGVASRTVNRDCKAAKAWLAARIRRNG